MTVFEHKRTTKAGHKDPLSAAGSDLSKAMRKQVAQFAKFKHGAATPSSSGDGDGGDGGGGGGGGGRGGRGGGDEEAAEAAAAAAPHAEAASEAAAANEAAATVGSAVPHKKRLSKVERNRLKRAGPAAVAAAAAAAATDRGGGGSSGGGGGGDGNDGEALEKKKDKKPEDFRDGKFYLAREREGARGEEHLMVHAQEMDDAELDLGAALGTKGAVEVSKSRKT